MTNLRADFGLTLTQPAASRTDPASLHEQLPPPNGISSARAEEISTSRDVEISGLESRKLRTVRGRAATGQRRQTTVDADHGRQQASVDAEGQQPQANVTRAEYAALIAQVTALHARVAAIEDAARHRHGSVTVTDEQLLIAVAAAVAERAFTAAELLAHAGYDESLRHALAVAGISNARRLGKLFRRFEGSDIAGLQLVRIGRDCQGIVWRVMTFHRQTVIDPPCGARCADVEC